MKQVVVHQPTARYAAGLEMRCEGAGVPQVPSGPVRAQGTASGHPQYLGPLLSTLVLELNAAGQPCSVQIVSSLAGEAMLISTAWERLVRLGG